MKNKKNVIILSVILLLTIGLLLWFFVFSKVPAKPMKHQDKPAQGIQVSTDFHTHTFSSKKEALMLKLLKLCDTTVQWSEDENRPSCTPNFFRVFPLKKGLDLSNGCMVLLKAGVNRFPVRRFVVYEKEGEQLVQANGFIGYPIEFRPQANNYDDVVIRFFERYEGEKYFYNCLFTWKQNRYQFVQCEQINDANIKPEKQKEVSTEILQILNEKQLVF